MDRWERLQSNFSKRIKDINFDWIEDDFVINGFWNSDATFILLHWTAFNNDLIQATSRHLAGCQEGVHVLTFTHPIPGNDFEILIQDTCVTSWGKTEFYFQEKITPARRINS